MTRPTWLEVKGRKNFGLLFSFIADFRKCDLRISISWRQSGLIIFSLNLRLKAKLKHLNTILCLTYNPDNLQRLVFFGNHINTIKKGCQNYHFCVFLGLDGFHNSTTWLWTFWAISSPIKTSVMVVFSSFPLIFDVQFLD